MNLKLKILVLKSGKSQSALCRQAGLTDTVFSRILHEWQVPREETKVRIASALGVRPQDIFPVR
jgi:lambda repressor-like predicted transcriptional regulator